MNKAIITVVGYDKVGIIAGVCNLLAENNVNILDLTQTILSGVFNMTMIVDVSGMKGEFADLADRLSCEGEKLGVQIRMQSEEIFQMMHRI
mgnify:FL=1